MVFLYLVFNIDFTGKFIWDLSIIITSATYNIFETYFSLSRVYTKPIYLVISTQEFKQYVLINTKATVRKYVHNNAKTSNRRMNNES